MVSDEEYYRRMEEACEKNPPREGRWLREQIVVKDAYIEKLEAVRDAAQRTHRIHLKCLGKPCLETGRPTVGCGACDLDIALAALDAAKEPT